MENEVVQGWITKSSMFKRLALQFAKSFVTDFLDPVNTKPKIEEWVKLVSTKLAGYPEAKKVWDEFTKNLSPDEIAQLVQTVGLALLDLIPV